MTEAALRALRPPERAVLASVAGGQPSVYAQATLDGLGLSKSQVQRAVHSLEVGGHLTTVGRGRWAFVDPLRAEWLGGVFSSGG